MPREADRLPGGRAGGDVRPQPPEDLPSGDQAGAESRPEEGVHHRPKGDLQPQVLSAELAEQTSQDRVVSRRGGARGESAITYTRDSTKADHNSQAGHI